MLRVLRRRALLVLAAFAVDTLGTTEEREVLPPPTARELKHLAEAANVILGELRGVNHSEALTISVDARRIRALAKAGGTLLGIVTKRRKGRSKAAMGDL
jgi:hypothetical protein